MGLDSSGSGQGPVIGFREHRKEHLGSRKTGNLTCWLIIGLSRTLYSMSLLALVGSEVFQCHIRPLWWEGNKENSVLSQQFQLNGDSVVLITYLDILLLDDIAMTRQTASNNSIKLHLRHFAYQRRYKNHTKPHKSSFFCHHAIKLLITLLWNVDCESSSVYSHLKMEHTIRVFSHVSTYIFSILCKISLTIILKFTQTVRNTLYSPMTSSSQLTCSRKTSPHNSERSKVRSRFPHCCS